MSQPKTREKPSILGKSPKWLKDGVICPARSAITSTRADGYQSRRGVFAIPDDKK
jgi:hypothetical protein